MVETTYFELVSEIMDTVYRRSITDATKLGFTFEKVLYAIYDSYEYRGGDFNAQLKVGMGAFDTLTEYLYLEVIFASLSAYTKNDKLREMHKKKINQILSIYSLAKLTSELEAVEREKFVYTFNSIGAKGLERG